RRDAQGAGDGLAARHGVDADLAQALEHGAGVLVERLARLGRAHAPRRALQEARADLGLEARHRSADARFRLAHCLRRRGEAAALDHLAEGLDVVPVHGRDCSGSWTISPEVWVYRFSSGKYTGEDH